MSSLEKLWRCLATMQPELVMDETIRRQALVPIQRMLEMSR